MTPWCRDAARKVILSALLVVACVARAQEGTDTKLSSAEVSLKAFLQTLDHDKQTRYIAAFRDLNDDGTPEAIVYLIGKRWCGSGGCNTLVLK
jgi:hypothetical protein